MRRNRKWILLLLIIITATLSFICFYHRKILVEDGFETASLSNIWSTKRMERGSWMIQSDVKHNGHSAAKISIKTGDKAEAATLEDKATERDELTEAMSLYAIEGQKYEYRFSMRFPDSFPITPTRLVIAQWKQYCPFCSCSEYSPILALRYISGKLLLTIQTSSKRDTLYISSDECRGRWLNFRVSIRFSQQNNGTIEAFLNDSPMCNYRGITSYSNNCLVLSDKNKYYFKMGLYRDSMEQPMSIYIDDYQKIQLDSN